MANIFVMPTTNDFPWYQQRVTISEVVYTITIRYNSRMSRWMMDIGDAVNNLLHVGVPILIERDLLGQYVVQGLPPGLFYAIDETNQGTEPTRFAFKTTHGFFYYDPDADNAFGL